MSLSERDRKILMLIIPLVVLAGYWFLILSPKREEASVAAEQLAVQEQRLDTAQAAADEAKNAENAFESDFTEVVRLGKAIPANVDMPSLIVQLDRAAAGTDIHFTKIATGEREATAAAAAAAAPAAPADGSAGTPAAAGGETASSAPGTAVESANDAAAEQSGVSPTDTQTSTTAGAPTTDATGATTTTTTGLETVPLELEFVGDFFDLADFFHSVKRFVRVANQNVLVGGRLVVVEGVQWASDAQLFPRLKATIDATVYLAPKAEGTTAGATPQGPAAESTTPAGTSAADSGASPVPTATATP